jgi:hypothetical protein
LVGYEQERIVAEVQGSTEFVFEYTAPLTLALSGFEADG